MTNLSRYLTDIRFEIARDAIAAHPGLPSLERAEFGDRSRWAAIPDEQGRMYKAEFVICRTPALTAKINIWFLPDRRGAGLPKPHNHPWPFTAHILTGGYTEDRYQVIDGQIHESLNVQHEAGTRNPLAREDYHEVRGLLAEPGDTTSLMVCEEWAREGWGYLDMDTCEHVPDEPDPTFAARFAALNPGGDQR